MIELDEDLPPGALIGGSASELAATMPKGALWLHGTAGAFARSGETVTGWQSQNGERFAEPTAPNEGNGRMTPWAGEGRCGLVLRAGTHCGMVVSEIAAKTEVFSAALVVRLAGSEPGRTLLSVNGNGTEGRKSAPYLFLSDDGDSLTVKDTEGAVALTVPASPHAGEPLLLTLTLDGDTLFLRQGFGEVHKATGAPPNIGAAALFIGARSQRSGLLKTLGAAEIGDVFFWPGLRLLHPKQPTDAAMDLALRRYVLWDC